MKKIFTTLLLLLIVPIGFSQSKKLWKGYFSYTEVKDISEGESKITVASENALFSKNLINGNVKTTNTIDGLSGQTITSIYHSKLFKKTLVGYQNGLIIAVNETDGSILNLVDIINKAIPPNVKKINHFMEYEGIVYVSCDFGIVQFNLSTMQFGDTYFIGNNGTQISVQQTAVFQNRIYAGTIANGIRAANINNPNLNDFNQWTTMDTNGWFGIETFGNELVAISTSGDLQRLNNGFFVQTIAFGEAVKDFRASGGFLLITTPTKIYIYNQTLGQVRVIPNTQIPQTDIVFSCATIIDNAIYIGTTRHGLFTSGLNDSSFENITPDGPVRNYIFSITATPKDLWATYGGYSNFFNPDEFPREGGPGKFSVSKLRSDGWLEIPYTDLFEAKALTSIAVNPANENQVFIASYNSGLLKIENEIPALLYNQTNSTLALPPGYTSVRVGGLAFDNSGNLWATRSSHKNALHVLRTNGQWATYDLTNALANGLGDNFGRLTIDKNGTKWMPSRDSGVIAFNETQSQIPKSMTEDPSKGELPASDVRVVAVDKRNQLWIGTVRGLRVLSSVDAFLSEEQMVPERIVVDQQDAAVELLYLQTITDIVVDGSNNKWIATADAGVFYLSADGQKTIYEFNTDNSPLPSNSINDIDINPATGEVFFATDKGMVSFNGIATAANDNLSNVFIYPNPVRPEFFGTVKISGLMDGANVKIADIEGNLVYEVFVQGGTIEWDTTAFGKYKVASGVYMVLISSEDGLETKVKKVMIVR